MRPPFFVIAEDVYSRYCRTYLLCYYRLWMDFKHTKLLSEKVSKSKLFRDYELAFSETTRLPLSFHAVETWQLSQHGKKRENPFCALLAASSRSCGECLENQRKISDTTDATRSSVCFAGLTDSAVPVHTDGILMGF